MQFIPIQYCVQSCYSSFHVPLLKFCSCQVYKEAASRWSSFNGKSTCSCESSSGINLSSPRRKHHRMADNSFRNDERELHIYNCELQHRGYYVRGPMRQEGYVVHTCCMFMYFLLYSVSFSVFSVFYSLCLRSVRFEWQEVFRTVPLPRLFQAVFFQAFMWACNEIVSIRDLHDHPS